MQVEPEPEPVKQVKVELESPPPVEKEPEPEPVAEVAKVEPVAEPDPAAVVALQREPRFAYAYVVGGCDPSNAFYKAYLYNILVAARILRDEGSKADIVLMIQVRTLSLIVIHPFILLLTRLQCFQMASQTDATVLPEEDSRLLEAMKIKVIYIPKSKTENFYTTMLDKFRILGLVEYDRILFMDGDVMPVTSLDYIMEMSVKYVASFGFYLSSGCADSFD
jgi:hypothetical protein